MNPKSRLKQFRNPELSLWQSAVDEVVARKKAKTQTPDTSSTGSTPTRPNPAEDAMVDAAARDVTEQDQALQTGTPLSVPTPPPKPATGGIPDVVKYCSTLARNFALAKFRGDTDLADRYHEQLTDKFTVCDLGWGEIALKYAEFLASRQQVPYRVYTRLSDYVIDGKLKDTARVALVGDWGTGQDPAIKILAQIARKNPDVVIHMGDIYYSATQFEVDSYFYQIWSDALDLTKIATYSLSGNHDMFSGGQPYYNLLDKLGQPASYFALRNAAWQLLAIDTGLNDRDPVGTVPTFLQDTEVTWLQDKINQANGRKTILLSHHQLFSAFENIGGQAVNDHLYAQLSGMLPNLTVWFWGHEHSLVLYQKYLGVLARCIGHGAFPVGNGESPVTPKFPEIPVEPVRLDLDADQAFYNHGYVILDFDGPNAKASYYQESDENTPEFVESFRNESPANELKP
jgi:3',5'-cyclic AMP phosphodiesterase CpdA